MVGQFYRCCALPCSFACPGPPDLELCYQNRGGTLSEFLIDLLFAYNEEIPHSFQPSSKLVEILKENLVVVGWLALCV
jgi:hypothetical protein